jgi:hypothetical protein
MQSYRIPGEKGKSLSKIYIMNMLPKSQGIPKSRGAVSRLF